MQNNRTFHASRIFAAPANLAALGALAALALLAGCASTTVTNMTPSALPANPSQTYTITARVKPSASNVIPNSKTVEIMIGGQAYKMTETPNIDNVYEFDYKAPAGVAEIAYYFLVEYNVSNSGIVSARTDYSPLQHATIVARDTTGLSASRGPAGARVAITGRGFTANDSVFFDDTPVRPTFESENSLSFLVPSLEAGRAYAVSAGDAPGKMDVGSFFIDPSGSNAANAPAPGAYAIATNANANGANDSAVGANDASATAFGANANASANAADATANANANASTAAAASTNAAAANVSSFSNAPQTPAPAVTGNTTSANAPTNDITVSPMKISIYTGEYIVLKFETPRIVKGRPLLIDVTTDIPASVIMPEVYVKVGSNVGSVHLKGGKPGTGHLFVKAAGYAKRLTIPITVK